MPEIGYLVSRDGASVCGCVQCGGGFKDLGASVADTVSLGHFIVGRLARNPLPVT